MSHKLHIISFDGLSKVDMDFLKTCDNFKRFLDGASYSFEVESVYPSLTYPAHTSIITGNYPNKHGIINNMLLQPYRNIADWFWYSKYIKTENFRELATKNGYTVLSIFWPVSAGAKIKYNMPEIFANRFWSNQIAVSLMSGSKKFQLDMLRRFGHHINGIKQPALDNFIHSSYIHSLKYYKTDITMVHYIDLDSIRHDFGFNSPEANDALKRHDKRLGEILDTIEKSGEMEDTTIIVLGDHSCKDAENIIFLNRIFFDEGMIRTKKGKIVDYDVFAKETGGSTYIYSRGDVDFEEIKSLIESKIPKEAIEAIYTPEEANELGADPNCFMMLEASEGYLFEDAVAPKALMTIDELKGSKINYHTNNHGYSPYLKKDYETVFMAKGKGIKENINIGKMRLVDEGPTFAKIMGLDLKDTDGRVLEEILTGD